MSVKIFYLLKKFIPRRLQIGLRRMIAIIKRKKYQNVWPINYNASNKPKNWNGWPEKKQFAFIITHDVDTKKGYERCKMLMNIDKEKGFRSSFNFVPERYKISGELINEFN